MLAHSILGIYMHTSLESALFETSVRLLGYTCREAHVHFPYPHIGTNALGDIT